MIMIITVRDISMARVSCYSDYFHNGIFKNNVIRLGGQGIVPSSQLLFGQFWKLGNSEGKS